MRFVLVRHAEPAWSEGGINRDDPRLTARGERQALLVAATLAEDEFDHVWISPARRAQETAAPFLDLTGTKATTHPFLEEIRNPEWEGTDHDALEIFAAHRRRHPELQWEGLDGGEAVTDFHDRVCGGLDPLLADLGVARSGESLPTWDIASRAQDVSVLLFAHAGTNSVILTHLLGMAPVPWEWERLVTRHTSVSEVHPIEIGDRHAFSMSRLSDTRHLPDHLLTR